MLKESFNRVIDSLEIRYVLSESRKVVKPVELGNTLEKKDILIQCRKGFFSAGSQHEQIHPGEFYFIPRESIIHFRHGLPPYESLGPEGFISPEQREKFVKAIGPEDAIFENDHVFDILAFEVTVYGAVPFFTIMQLPCIRMGADPELSEIIHRIRLEEMGSALGKQSMIKKYTDQIIIRLCRNIFESPDYKEQIGRLDYLLDKRLVDIIEYIQNNLGDDLSNQRIAELAFVSKDYIGQFFKTLTNHNLQDYIESRRLEQAHFLLRSTNDSVQEIARKVGFKDPAYFSRRFRLKYNLKARDVRDNDSLML